jgi:hypothetical protein
VEHQRGTSLELALALLADIKLGVKGLPGTNTLTYWAHSEVIKKIKCSECGPRGLCSVYIGEVFFKKTFVFLWCDYTTPTYLGHFGCHIIYKYYVSYLIHITLVA